MTTDRAQEQREAAAPADRIRRCELSLDDAAFEAAQLDYDDDLMTILNAGFQRWRADLGMCFLDVRAAMRAEADEFEANYARRGRLDRRQLKAAALVDL